MAGRNPDQAVRDWICSPRRPALHRRLRTTALCDQTICLDACVFPCAPSPSAVLTWPNNTAQSNISPMLARREGVEPSTCGITNRRFVPTELTSHEWYTH